VELTRLAGLYQLNGVLESCRPVKSVSKGFTDQRVGRCMVPTLTSMNFCEQLAAFVLGDAPHVSLSQTGNLISGSHIIGKDVVFQVGPDLCYPCIGPSLSFWILRARMHGVSRDAYDPRWAPW
jgi:hypothetical protein